MEESKTQENAKLQLALQEVQDQLKETKVSLIKEVEAAKKTAEMVTVVKEVPIVDTELVEKLKSENENLKVWNLRYSFLFLEYQSCRKPKQCLEIHFSFICSPW